MDATHSPLHAALLCFNCDSSFPSSSALLTEPVSYYCPSCLFELPSSAARSDRQRYLSPRCPSFLLLPESAVKKYTANSNGTGGIGVPAIASSARVAHPPYPSPRLLQKILPPTL